MKWRTPRPRTSPPARALTAALIELANRQCRIGMAATGRQFPFVLDVKAWDKVLCNLCSEKKNETVVIACVYAQGLNGFCHGFCSRLAVAALCSDAVAQSASPSLLPAHPTKAIRLIVPFPPGGAVDAIGRIIGRSSPKVSGMPS
jgi:hypothetical protein